MPKGKILAIDYGRKRIGLAISDPDRLIAFLKGFIVFKTKEQVFEDIKNICNENKIVLIIIGIPHLLDMRTTDFTNEVKHFGDELCQFLNIDIEFVDETLSSFEADEMMMVIPKSKKTKLSGVRDEISAKIILQRWMEQENLLL